MNETPLLTRKALLGSYRIGMALCVVYLLLWFAPVPKSVWDLLDAVSLLIAETCILWIIIPLTDFRGIAKKITKLFRA